MESRGSDDNDREKQPAKTDILLWFSIPGINCVPPTQATAWDLLHPPVFKSHATTQVVSGCVSIGDVEWPLDYPHESSDCGVTLEILGMKEQDMNYLSQIS